MQDEGPLSALYVRGMRTATRTRIPRLEFVAALIALAVYAASAIAWHRWRRRMAADLRAVRRRLEGDRDQGGWPENPLDGP